VCLGLCMTPFSSTKYNDTQLSCVFEKYMTCSNLVVVKPVLLRLLSLFCLMDTSGAMGLFKKLDVGPLELGDYLGWIYTRPFSFSDSLIRPWMPLSIC
jgi:hypothetical protein